MTAHHILATLLVLQGAPAASIPLAVGRTVTQAAPGARALAVGQSAQGQLTRGDTFRESDSTYAQSWTLEGRAGQIVTIDLESDAFDAFLFLSGPGLERPLQDDDSGGTCNARLTTNFTQGGTFTVVVNSAEKYGTGRFTLSVTSGAKPKSLSPCSRSQ